MIDGRIPDSLTNLTRLKRLDLSENQPSGTLPTTLETLTNLASLDLSHNRLSWMLPENLDRLAGLQELKISGNYFIGPVPKSLNSLRWLTNLSLADNQLSGVFPALAALRNATIDLTSNSIAIDAGSQSFSNIQAVMAAGNSVKYQPQLTSTNAEKFLKPRKKPLPPPRSPSNPDQPPQSN